MRKLVIAFVLLATIASAADEKGLKPGFRDLKWKDQIPEGMTKKVGDEISGMYVRDADKLSIGDVQLTSVTYTFFGKQFSGVLVETKNGAGLLRVLTENWGKPNQPNEYIESYLWSKGDTLAGFEINSASGAGTLTLFSQSLYEATEKAKNEKAAKAKSDL